MQQQVKHRMFKSFGAHTVGNIITMTDRFFTIPIFLTFWGMGTFGEWVIIRALPAYLASADMGFANAAGNELTELHTQNQKEKANVIFQTVLGIILVASIVVCLLLLLLANLFSFYDVFNIKELSRSDFLSSMVYAAVYILLIFQTQLVYSVARSLGLHDISVWVLNVVRIVEIVVVITIVYAGGGVLAAAFAYALCRLLGVIGMYAWMKRIAPWLSFNMRYCSWHEMKRLFRPALSFTLLPISAAINLQGSILVISAMTTPAYAGAFSALRTLSRLVFQFGTQVNKTIWPEISIAYASQDTALLFRLHCIAMKTTLFGSVLMGGGLIVFGEILVSHWGMGKIPYDFWLFVWLIIGVVFNSLWFASSSVLLGMGRHEKMTLFYAVINVFMLSVAPAVFSVFHGQGFACMLVLIEVVTLCYVLHGSLKATGNVFLDFFRYRHI